MRYNKWLPYQYLATPLKEIQQLAVISIFCYTPKRCNNWMSYQYLATPLKEIYQLAAILIFNYTTKRDITIGFHINI